MFLCMERIDDWILPQDKLPLFLAYSLYSQPIMEYNGYQLVESGARYGIWVNEELGIAIVAYRGTSVGATDGSKDLLDDAILAGIRRKNSCDLSIIENGDALIRELIKQEYEMISVGHSLGGAAALCIANKYPKFRAISFNGGAPPTRPVVRGPGPERATHYHVFGDLISTHMYPQAARVIRVRKPGPTWGTAYPHSMDRMFEGDSWEYVTANEEQESLQQWSSKIPSVNVRLLVCNRPIPESTVRCRFRYF